METEFRYHYVPIPDDIAEALREEDVRRVIATINGHDIRRGIQYREETGTMLVLGRDKLKAIGAVKDDLVTVDLRPDPDPDYVELGEELEAALDQDPEALERWETFPTGRRRSLASYVTRAKRPETRIRRALDLCKKIRTHTLYGDKND